MRAIASAEAFLRLILVYAWNDGSLWTTAAAPPGRRGHVVGCGPAETLPPGPRLAGLSLGSGVPRPGWGTGRDQSLPIDPHRWPYDATPGEPRDDLAAPRPMEPWYRAVGGVDPDRCPWSRVLDAAACDRTMSSWPTAMMPSRTRSRGWSRKGPMSWCGSGGMPCGGKPGTVPLGRCWRPCGTCRPWPGDWPVQIPGTADRPALPLRLVTCARRPAPPSARGQARQDAGKHGHTPTAATLEAADYVLVLTSLPRTAADAAEILELYRLRWQIECAFKRLKSLLHLYRCAS